MLDTGDALIGGGVLGDRTQGEAVVAAMNLMAYDAMALGLKELTLGAETLLARMEQATFPMLSANVRQEGSAQLFADAYVILEVAGRRIGVVGLTQSPDEPVDGFEVLEPKGALSGVLDELREQVDTVILLTNLPYRAAIALASSVRGMDLVVAARPGQLPSQAVAAATGTLVVAAEQPFARHTGRRVGQLAVTWHGDGSLTDPSWQSVAMTLSVVDDPLMKALLDGYK